MSSGWALVRFNDGTVRAAIYHGTSDVLVPRLYDTIPDAWDGRRDEAVTDWPEPEGDEEPCVIFTDYGWGFWWEGRAARNVVTFGVQPHGAEDQGGRELEPRLPIHDDRPAWVDAWLAKQPTDEELT